VKTENYFPFDVKGKKRVVLKMSGYNWIVAFEFALPSSHCYVGQGKEVFRESVLLVERKTGVCVG